MPSWPQSFPPLFNTEGFSLDPLSNTTPIETESGEPLTRVRFTGEMDDIAGEFPMMDRDTAIQMMNFWRYDLKNGSLRFSYDHPLTGEAAEFLFMDKPRVTAAGGDLWKVAVQLRSMPT